MKYPIPAGPGFGLGEGGFADTSGGVIGAGAGGGGTGDGDHAATPRHTELLSCEPAAPARAALSGPELPELHPRSRTQAH